MPLSDAQLKRRVRSFTVDSVTELPDDQILYFAGRGADTSYQDNLVGLVLDIAGVIADCWTYLARDDRYMSETQGAVSVSQPVALRQAAFWASKSAKGGGIVASSDTVKRTDIMASAFGPQGFDGEFDGLSLWWIE